MGLRLSDCRYRCSTSGKMEKLPTEILEKILMYAAAAESNDSGQRWPAVRSWLSAVSRRWGDIVQQSTFQNQYREMVESA